MILKQKISVLGCGWLGLPLAQSLALKQYDVKGSTTTPAKIADLKSSNIAPCIIKIEDLNPEISDFFDSDILIIPVPSKNIEAFSNLVKAIETSTVKKIIYISSTSVYNNSDDIVDENSNLNNSPLTLIEKLFRDNKNFETIIIRFAGLFGYNRQPGNFFSQSKRVPNPEGPVNMIHRDDCINIIEKIIELNIGGNIFNACADSHPTRREFYTAYSEAIGKKAPIFEENSILEKKIISNKKIKETLKIEFLRELLPPVTD